jgi:hypothetical protein
MDDGSGKLIAKDSSNDSGGHDNAWKEPGESKSSSVEPVVFWDGDESPSVEPIVPVKTGESPLLGPVAVRTLA